MDIVLRIPEEGNVIVDAPTGTGKTMSAILQAIRAARDGRRSLVLCPLRALARELFESLRSKHEDLPVGLFTGEIGENPPVPFNEARVLVMTPERLEACTRSWRSHWSWIPELDLAVIDELHLVADPHRGGRLESAVSRLRRLNPFCRWIGLSATLSSHDDLARWLDAKVVVSRERPVPISWRVLRYDSPTEKVNLATEEVRRCVALGGRSLVFVQSRRRAEDLAQTFLRAGLRASHHHGGLSQRSRASVEDRCRRGEIEVLVATPTLEMGVNLPFRQVLLFDLQRFDGASMVPLPVTTVRQRVGRAGRPGMDSEGEAVLLASKSNRWAERYSEADCEPLSSALRKDSVLSELIVSEVASGLSKTTSQLARAVETTFGGPAVGATLPSLLSEMVSAGMLRYEVSDDKPQPTLKTTRLGRIVSRHMLSPRTVRFLNCFLERPRPSVDVLLFLLGVCPEAEPHLLVDFEELDDLQPWAQRIGEGLGDTPDRVALCLRTTGRRLASAIKKTRLLRLWAQTGDEEQAADSCGTYVFELQRLKESYLRLLLALSDLASCQKAGELQEWVSLASCVKTMLEAGIPPRASTLALVPGIGPATARKLQTAGIEDIEDLALADPEDVAQATSRTPRTSMQWIEEAHRLAKTHGSRWLDSDCEDLPPSTPRQDPGSPTIDPYRLRRSLSLRVARVSTHRWLVTGGSEERTVRRAQGKISCDCPDHRKGNTCKHILAVRRVLRDAGVLASSRKLISQPSEWNIHHLWMDRDHLELEP